jgi:WD40 repeat protein
MLSSLPEDALYHILKFVDENDDARCARISKSWASLRRAWVVRHSGPRAHVCTVAFSHDGTFLAVGSIDYEVATQCQTKVYDVATGDLLHTLPRSSTRCIAFSPIDRMVLAVGRNNPRVDIYNLATGESSELWHSTVPRDSWVVSTVAFSPDASTLAFCRRHMAAIIGIDGPARVSPARVLATTPDTSTGYLGEDGQMHGAVFSATGAVLAVAVGTTIKCYDVATGLVRNEFEYEGQVRDFTGSPRGIVSVGGEGKLALYDVSTGHLRRELTSTSPFGVFGLPYEGRGLRVTMRTCFSPEGSVFAAQDADAIFNRRISIYDAETGELRRKITRNQSRIIGAFTFSPDGKTLALADVRRFDTGSVHRVALYDASTGDLRRMHRQPQALPAPPTA